MSFLFKMYALIALLLTVVFVISCRKQSYTPEYFYKDSKAIELCYAISNRDQKKIEELIKQGVDINVLGKDGMTPLLWALKSKDKKIYEMILKKGGDPKIKITHDRFKNKSVMNMVCLMDDSDFLEITLKYAKRTKNEKISQNELGDAIDSLSLKKVKMLVAAGADVNKRDACGTPPLLNAAMLNQYHIVYFLLQAGADYNQRTTSGLSLFETIEDSNELMSRKGFRYQYLLKCAKFLKDKGIKVDISKPQKYPEK